MMDRTELEQVLMNLIINAADAMHGGGALTVTTKSQPVSAAEAALHGVATGVDVRILIADTGDGIAPEVRERVFEPYFTTKTDKGTGMGLATVYGIVDQAGGWIDLDTAVGVGTTFQIMLPAAPSPSRSDDPAEESAGRCTVLVVEDEPALRALVVSMLEEHGYLVLPAGTWLAAIALAERHPGVSGPELALRLRGLRPKLEVLYMSGYNDSRLVNSSIDNTDFKLLVKPFTPEELIERVRALTEGAARALVAE
jgi:hypothetical protein